ncbi:MAG: hypothetical protein WCK28_05930 [Burkholderiales bacterium]
MLSSSIVITLLVAACTLLWVRVQRYRREAFVRRFVFPPGLFAKLRARHPQLAARDCMLVAQGLRQFFLAHLLSGRQFVSMPSQVADDLWHEFILYTRHYREFCNGAFGRFLDHTPAVVLGADRRDNSGLRRCWTWACRDENIDPRKPARLPLLFALDRKLGIAGGFEYLADCMAERLRAGGSGGPHCGGDFSDTGYDGGTDGLAESGGGSDGGDGDGGGGCGGD